MYQDSKETSADGDVGITCPIIGAQVSCSHAAPFLVDAYHFKALWHAGSRADDVAALHRSFRMAQQNSAWPRFCKKTMQFRCNTDVHNRRPSPVLPLHVLQLPTTAFAQSTPLLSSTFPLPKVFSPTAFPAFLE